MTAQGIAERFFRHDMVTQIQLRAEIEKLLQEAVGKAESALKKAHRIEIGIRSQYHQFPEIPAAFRESRVQRSAYGSGYETGWVGGTARGRLYSREVHQEAAYLCGVEDGARNARLAIQAAMGEAD